MLCHDVISANREELSDIAEGILSITRPAAGEKLFTTSILQAAMIVKSENENVHEIAIKIDTYAKDKRYLEEIRKGNLKKAEAILNSAAIVNGAYTENGRAKVFYHQTEDDFTVFDIGREGAGTRDNENANSVFFHYLYGVVKEKGHNTVIKLTVEEQQIPVIGDIKRAYKLIDITKHQPSGVGSANNLTSSQAADAIKTISDLYKFVKTYDKGFNPSSLEVFSLTSFP